MRQGTFEPASLRAEAEARIVCSSAKIAPDQTLEELVHELQVHQIELEMQNETLRQTQLALEKSRDRFADLYEFAPVGYLTLCPEGLIQSINLTGAELLKSDRKSLLLKRFTHLVSAESRDRWHRAFTRITLRHLPLSCELTLKRGDGTEFSARLDCMNARGEDPAIRVSLSDITEIKRTEEELRIAAIAFCAPDAMIVTDPNGVILRVNEAFTKLTGYSAEDAIGKTPAMRSSGQHDPAFYRRMWASLRETGSWQGEIWNRRKNGNIYAEWVTISAVAAPGKGVTHYIGTFSDIARNSEAAAEIHRLAYYDPLTHLPNRRLLLDRIGQELVSSSRTGHFGALLFMDLDNFKRLNDTRGHDAGDLLLIEVAGRIQSCVREGDTVARLGGDEFVVVLQGLSTDGNEAAVQAGAIAEKIRTALAQGYELVGRKFHCSTSVGITLFSGNEVGTETLLRQADMAMYMAKSAGRNTLHFFDPAMQAAIDERAALEADLRVAVELGQLQLLYQPQFDANHHIIGAEALLRWNHPRRGTIMPVEFIPLAEDSGLILGIGQWVLDSACADIARWAHTPATHDLRVAVNVSGRQFRMSSFTDTVAKALAQSGAEPDHLKIELTESLVMENVEESIAHLQTLRAMGVGSSMDNFGTGFSSLASLKRLPLDQLKIDRAFVRDLPTDPSDVAIVQTIIAMGQALGREIIAEGVERQAQEDCLSGYGCSAFQGYLFAKPLTFDDFTSLVAGQAAGSAMH